LEFGVVTKNYVEIMEITAGSSKDEDPLHSAIKASLDP
jgi:hypothetical protein